MQDDLPADQGELDTPGTLRVKVTSNRLPSEHVDGAWWPRSNQLTAELPALLSSLSDRLGKVVAVGYPRDGWTDVPHQVDIDGDQVQLLCFTSDDPAGVIVIGQDGHHLTLRVIAPDTTEQAAQVALAQIPDRANGGTADSRPAAAPRTLADVAERLAGHEGRHDHERTAEITRWCAEAAAEFEGAPVQSFVPILVEHIVHNRMVEARTASPTPSDAQTDTPRSSAR